MDKTILVLWWATLTTLWLLAMTRWRKGILERSPAGSAAWYWLRVFGVEESDRNRARFLVGVCATGIVLLSAITLAVLVWGQGNT